MSRKGPPREEPAGSEARLADNPIAQRLQTIAMLTREIEKKLGERLGVNLTDLAAMEQLITHGPLTPSELAARLQVTPAASTQIVDRLERVGHASRERQSDDRRKLLVVPAEASVKQTYQHLAPMLKGLDTLVTQLREPERELIERFLGQVIDVYRATVSSIVPPAPPSE